jgi:putative addiction module component (TIGR02574 family)
MSPNFRHVIEEAKHLNPNERAIIAHCLISSLESNQEDYVDSAWADLAEKRYDELISGKVNPVTWEEMKKDING